jgi:glycosyltransferase involved in cell wall biosynthesis
MEPESKVLLITYLYPDRLERIVCDQKIRPSQTQNFGMSLLYALKEGFGDNVEVFSSAPLLDFPHNKCIVAPYAIWTIYNSIPATMLPYINLFVVKHISRFVATFLFVLLWVTKNRNKKRIILLHGVNSSKLWAVNLIKIFFPSIITVSYLTDDVGIPLKWQKKIINKIRQFDTTIIYPGLQRMSGIITMTEPLTTRLAKGRPFLLIPTIQKPDHKVISDYSANPNSLEFIITYSGGLSRDYGADLLLEAFGKSEHPDWKLVITGWGEMEDDIRASAKSDPRIDFRGFISLDELKNVYHSTTILVNPKRINSRVAEYSFPSKIIEYLSTGKPVVSTNLLVLDESIRKHMIIAENDTPEGILKCLEEVYAWDKSHYEVWRSDSLRFVQEELSPSVQGRKILRFLSDLRP